MSLLKKSDKSTQGRIDLLHPLIREEVRLLIEVANERLGADMEVRIVQGLRTFPEQESLYNQGRKNTLPKVTNAKAGQSFHNYGLAIDFCLLRNDKEIIWDTKRDFDGDKISDWLEVVQVFIKKGYSWGGDWTSLKDLPHIEKTFGHSWNDLLARHNKKNFIKGTEYVNI